MPRVEQRARRGDHSLRCRLWGKQDFPGGGGSDGGWGDEVTFQLKKKSPIRHA